MSDEANPGAAAGELAVFPRATVRAIWSARLAATIFFAKALFHAALVLGAPWGRVVWSGWDETSAASKVDFSTLSSIAMLMLLGFGAAVLAKANLLRRGETRRALDVVVWIIAADKLMNTILNFLAGTLLDTIIFALLDAVATVACVIVASTPADPSLKPKAARGAASGEEKAPAEGGQITML
jgi:hypothetical protein